MVKTAVFTGNRVPISGLSHWVKKEEMGTLLSIVTEGGPTRDLAWGFEVLCKKTTLCHYYMPSSVPNSPSLTLVTDPCWSRHGRLKRKNIPKAPHLNKQQSFKGLS